ncbi:MAG: phytoene desaturase [Deltaproteobacteria bacterium]|nr:phytoene desaturase [Deltaproteobacteria bacterium]
MTRTTATTTAHEAVVVIGAGMGGLSAAIALGAAGRRVVLLEAGDDVGGKVGEVVADGVGFDTGPSVLTLPDILDDILGRAGMSVAADVVLVRPGPAFRYRFPSGRVLDVFVAVDETLASVERALGRRARDELAAFLWYARDIWETSKDDFVFGPAPSVATLLRLALTRPLDMLKVDPLSSMQGALQRKITDPDLRLLLMRYATYNGSDPFSAPATLHCIAHVELALGGYGVSGGMMTIARALRRAADKVGVVVRTNARVRRIDVDAAGAVAGVVLDGDERLATRAVVVNADVAHLTGALLPSSARALPKPSAPSMSGATMVLKARRRTGPAARVAHEVLFPADYQAEFDDIFRRRQSPRDPTVYVCAQEHAHGRTGWPDHEPLFVMANAPALQDGVVDDGEALLSRARARLLQAGMIEDDDAVVWQRTSGGLAERFFGSQGSLYGAASNTRQSAFARAPNVVTGVPGLYLASGTAHPGGGVPLCLQSGLRAARAVVDGR